MNNVKKEIQDIYEKIRKSDKVREACLPADTPGLRACSGCVRHLHVLGARGRLPDRTGRPRDPALCERGCGEGRPPQSGRLRPDLR